MSRLDVLKGQLEVPLDDFSTESPSYGGAGHLPKVPQSGRNDMDSERRKASFSVREMTYYMDAGKETTELKEKMMLEFERDPTFRMDDVHDLTRAELRERVTTRLRSIVRYVTSESIAHFRTRMGVLVIVDPGFLTRIGVHYGLFLNAITGQGTSEQVAYWISKGALDLKGVVGCFAMTELGHGSNVAGLETKATFDLDSDEFIIHTPTLTGTKWWIGGAAETATHAVVFANMIVKGKSYGVKSFIVSLRDPETFELQSGVSIGDCGAKMGRNAIDNGWLTFTNVRIPRTNLLMKYTKVTREGAVTEPPIAQLTYGALILGRVTMVRESADFAKKGLIIAVRYSVVRRQFSSQKGQLETRLIDYKTHQQRLIPLIALTYAMHFTGMEVYQIHENLLSMLDVAKPGDANMDEALEALKETHATSAGLKAYCSWQALNIIEQCRQACGGLGYSSYAGLASLYQDFVVQCSWEGDNTILTLQAGRYLITCCRQSMTSKKKMPTGISYLNMLPSILTKTCVSRDVADLTIIGEAFDVVSANHVFKATRVFESFLKEGVSDEEAYEKSASYRYDAAKIHCAGYLFHRFHDALKRAPEKLGPILRALCTLYGFHAIQENAGAFLQYNYFNPSHMESIKAKMLVLLDEIRPQVIPLTDAFNFTDYVINSPLGCADGDVYRRLFDLTLRQNPQRKHPYFERTIRPILLQKEPQRDRIEMDDEDEMDPGQGFSLMTLLDKTSIMSRLSETEKYVDSLLCYIPKTKISSTHFQLDYHADKKYIASPKPLLGDAQVAMSMPTKASANSGDLLAEADVSVHELRDRLQRRLKQLRSNCDNTSHEDSDVSCSQQRKEKKKAKELKRKPALEKTSRSGNLKKAKPGTKPASKSRENEPSFIFSKVEVSKKETNKPRAALSKDPKQALQKLALSKARISKLKEHDTQAAANLETKERWRKALQRSQGVVVKDDEALLRRSINRREKLKTKSGKDWAERKHKVRKSMEEQQQKRSANILKRKEEKKARKISKRR